MKTDGITFAVKNAKFLSDTKVLITVDLLCDTNPWEMLKHSFDKGCIFRRPLFCEFGQPIDIMNSHMPIKEKIERFHIVDENKVCLFISHISPLNDNEAIIDAEITGPYGDVLKSLLLDQSCEVFFGTRTMVSKTGPTRIVGIDLLRNPKRTK